jgi:hypothetical protein
LWGLICLEQLSQSKERRKKGEEEKIKKSLLTVISNSSAKRPVSLNYSLGPPISLKRAPAPV